MVIIELAAAPRVAPALVLSSQHAREATMKIDGATFGSITIDGETYDHNVIVRLSEKVEKRKKKMSKRRAVEGGAGSCGADPGRRR